LGDTFVSARRQHFVSVFGYHVPVKSRSVDGSLEGFSLRIASLIKLSLCCCSAFFFLPWHPQLCLAYLQGVTLFLRHPRFSCAQGCHAITETKVSLNCEIGPSCGPSGRAMPRRRNGIRRGLSPAGPAPRSHKLCRTGSSPLPVQIRNIFRRYSSSSRFSMRVTSVSGRCSIPPSSCAPT